MSLKPSSQKSSSTILWEIRNREDGQEAISVLAGRCALRVLPLLSWKGNFNYWTSTKRSDYLLTVWQAALTGWVGSIESIAANTNSVASVDAAATEDDVAYAVASAAIYASAISDITKVNDSAAKAAAIATSVSEIVYQAFNRDVFELDKNEINIDIIRNQSLWQLGIRNKKFEMIVYKLWPRALDKLATYESSKGLMKIVARLGLWPSAIGMQVNPENTPAAYLICQLNSDYQRLMTGDYSIAQAKKTIQKLQNHTINRNFNKDFKDKKTLEKQDIKYINFTKNTSEEVVRKDIMKHDKKIYVGSFVIVVIAIISSWVVPTTEIFKGIIASPVIGSLAVALYQLLRDQATFEKNKYFDSRKRVFDIGATSHMANIAFDKHVVFCEEYMEEVHSTVTTLFT